MFHKARGKYNISLEYTHDTEISQYEIHPSTDVAHWSQFQQHAATFAEFVIEVYQEFAEFVMEVYGLEKFTLEETVY